MGKLRKEYRCVLDLAHDIIAGSSVFPPIRQITIYSSLFFLYIISNFIIFFRSSGFDK